MSIDEHVILNYVDAPLRIIIWTVPELCIFIIPFFLGAMLGYTLMGLVISIIAYKLKKLYQKHFGRGQFQAVLYWYLPTSRRFKTLPPSYIREYIG